MDNPSVTAGAQEPANTNPVENVQPEIVPAEPASPYKVELERIQKKFEKELAHKERTIQSKDESNQQLLAELRELKGAFQGSNSSGEDETVEIEGTRFKKEEINSLNKVLKSFGISSDEWKGMRETLGELRTHLIETKEESHISRITSNPEEAELIRHHLKNTVKRTGNAEEDIANAYAIANKHMIEKKNDEETAIAAGMASVGGAEIGGSRITITPGMPSGKREALKMLNQWMPGKNWEKRLPK